jgi:hypothetical protein
MRLILFAMLVLLAAPAFAQQQPDPEFLKQVITALREQRDAAADQAAAARAQAAKLAALVGQLQKELVAKKNQAVPKAEPPTVHIPGGQKIK